MHLSSVDPSKVEDWIAWMHKARGDGVYKGLFVQAVQDALLCSAPRYKLPAYVRIFQRTARALYWFTYMPNQSDLSKKVVRALLEDFYAGIAELADDELLFLPVSRWLSIIERAIDLMSN
jgi:hypothetical protein